MGIHSNSTQFQAILEWTSTSVFRNSELIKAADDNTKHKIGNADFGRI